uniref:Uncharacterized protein n=1 Tax=Oryza brachyantha TaxID=4533 RepID=J3LBT3_ORYBR
MCAPLTEAFESFKHNQCIPPLIGLTITNWQNNSVLQELFQTIRDFVAAGL